MKPQNIKVAIGSRDNMAKDFVKAWKEAEAGRTPEFPEETLYFENEKILFKALTPRRCDLLRYVHAHGPTSILSLSKKLNRNYRNVHQDVKELNQIGLIIQDEKSHEYFVPWDNIVTEISLTEVKKASGFS